MIAWIQKMYLRFREQFWYLVVGGLTTVVDFVVYYLLSAVTPLNYMIIYGIAWAVSVVFAFFPNRSLVFCNTGTQGIGRQFVQFVSSRIATLLIGEGLLFVLVDLCHLPDGWMKPVVQVLIVVLNYVLSKLFVFRRRETENTSRRP
ncbi:MAG: GtrA family protein [Clostridia bacterium]|nr:GtrA family protein [Clostridia bacterium]